MVSSLLLAPLLHAAAVSVLTRVAYFEVYVVLVSMLIALAVFTHIFLFGLLARLDPSGRAVAATPAMLMVGTAIGPVLGGTVVKAAGYPALGLRVAAFGLLSAISFSLVRRAPPATNAAGQAA